MFYYDWRMQGGNERELVERCRTGDERAFQELVDRYKNRVFALIARTVQDRSRAEHLSQEVFLRVHRGLPYFRGEARLSTWIYRIVANVCVVEQGKPATGSIDDPGSRLERAIARLPANYRLVIAAHNLEGLQYDELADALQLPIATVRTQLHRAKQQLRRLLDMELTQEPK